MIRADCIYLEAGWALHAIRKAGFMTAFVSSSPRALWGRDVSGLVYKKRAIYVGMQVTSPSCRRSFVYARKRRPILDAYFSPNASSEAWVLYPEDLTSTGEIILPSLTTKSIS